MVGGLPHVVVVHDEERERESDHSHILMHPSAAAEAPICVYYVFAARKRANNTHIARGGAGDDGRGP